MKSAGIDVSHETVTIHLALIRAVCKARVSRVYTLDEPA